MHNSYRYKNILTNVKSDIWEGQFISVINEKTNKVIIGNAYRPPRDICENYQQFNKEFTEILLRLKKTKGEIAIVDDYNIDLLKIEHKPIIKDYLDSIMTQGFFPKITLPTRFSDLNCTLIDNVLCRLSHTVKPLYSEQLRDQTQTLTIQRCSPKRGEICSCTHLHELQCTHVVKLFRPW